AAHAASGRRLQAVLALLDGTVRVCLAAEADGSGTGWLPTLVTADEGDQMRAAEPSPWVTRGDRCARQGRGAEALFDYQKAKDLRRDAQADALLAEAYFRLADRKVGEEGSLDAEELATSGLELAPKDWRLWKVRAAARMNDAAKIDDAVKDAEQARQL